jgi:alpha-L-fucosidase
VAKHAGGFCWWRTQTTEYCVRNIPWKGGTGDLLGDVAESCRKAGLKLGIYIYPGDAEYGAGNGGITKDPGKQEAYNKIYREQLIEVLMRYGMISEVWFDGGCKIEVGDILKKYAPMAVVFQGPSATLRWPGTEEGRLKYPMWNTLSSKALATGVSTQADDDPDGDAWAPPESDIPLYNHYWFWAPANEAKRKSKEELLDIYYKSVGYGGVLLMNASPDTNGQIVPGDKALYKWFGEELARRFGTPLKEVKNIKGNAAEITFSQPTRVNHTILMEDYRNGQRIREYRIEGVMDGKWKVLATGSSVGRKKIDVFPDETVTSLRITVTKSKDVPMIRSFAAYEISGQ